MNNIEDSYKNLDDISKTAINAYRSGRQFMVTGMTTTNIVTLNNRIYPTIISSIVNEIFACELFLKSMIIIKTRQLSIKKHKLVELYNILNDDEIENNLSNYNFKEELQKINDSFTEWRYCYEYDSLQINRGFIFDMCRCLEKVSKKLILNTYNINMDKSFI